MHAAASKKDSVASSFLFFCQLFLYIQFIWNHSFWPALQYQDIYFTITFEKRILHSDAGNNKYLSLSAELYLPLQVFILLVRFIIYLMSLCVVFYYLKGL